MSWLERVKVYPTPRTGARTTFVMRDIFRYAENAFQTLDAIFLDKRRLVLPSYRPATLSDVAVKYRSRVRLSRTLQWKRNQEIPFPPFRVAF